MQSNEVVYWYFALVINMVANSYSACLTAQGVRHLQVSPIIDIKRCKAFILSYKLVFLHYFCLKLIEAVNLVPFFLQAYSALLKKISVVVNTSMEIGDARIIVSSLTVLQ